MCRLGMHSLGTTAIATMIALSLAIGGPPRQGEAQEHPRAAKSTKIAQPIATQFERETTDGSRVSLQQPVSVHKVFKVPTPRATGDTSSSIGLGPVIQMAREGFEHIRHTVRDYSCVMVRRERVDGRLRSHEFIYAKVRHRVVEGDRVVVPFSVYLKFLKPSSVAGREVLYVEGQNDGEMLARRGGTRFAFVTTRVDPHSEVAMTGNRYPITEFGIENLLYRLHGSAVHAAQGPCQVRYLAKAKINGRPALGIVVRQENRQPADSDPSIAFREARIYVDEELQVPLHYESYDWPEEGTSEMPLLEQYTYTKLQLNPGFTDEDFSADNPAYHVK